MNWVTLNEEGMQLVGHIFPEGVVPINSVPLHPRSESAAMPTGSGRERLSSLGSITVIVYPSRHRGSTGSYALGGKRRA